ncbi:MAG TPA: hypothetical protein VN231_08130 [Allosphingosinicella sp.]|nr:hypothetical protein [Allosphingosinicella sp.]
MSSQLHSGLSIMGPAESTFFWDVTEDDGNLTVQVSVGSGTTLSSARSAFIPAHSEAKVPLFAVGNVAAQETISGNVWAEWTKDGHSYVVMFSGNMSAIPSAGFPVASLVCSSDRNGGSVGQGPLIVYAHIAN